MPDRCSEEIISGTGLAGRVRLTGEDMVSVAFEAPRSSRDALDREAWARDGTRNQFPREVLDQALGR